MVTFSYQVFFNRFSTVTLTKNNFKKAYKYKVYNALVFNNTNKKLWIINFLKDDLDSFFNDWQKMDIETFVSTWWDIYNNLVQKMKQKLEKPSLE